jgi:hypothetical protein
LDKTLNRVMQRFRDFFIGQGIDPEGVPFRSEVRRSWYLHGYTYGVRLVADGNSRRDNGRVSANVYSDEFDMSDRRTRRVVPSEVERRCGP